METISLCIIAVLLIGAGCARGGSAAAGSESNCRLIPRICT